MSSIVTLGNTLFEGDDGHAKFFMNVIPSNVTTAEDYKIFTALHSDDTETVLTMIQSNIGINAVDKWGQTPLMLSAIKKSDAIFIELLNSRKIKVNINAAKPSGYSVSKYQKYLYIYLFHTILCILYILTDYIILILTD